MLLKKTLIISFILILTILSWCEKNKSPKDINKEIIMLQEEMMKETIKKNHSWLITLYNKTIKLDPEQAWAWLGRWASKYKLNDFLWAKKDINIAIELDWSIWDWYLLKGMNEMELWEYEDAYDSFTKAIELNPKDHVSYFYLSDLLYMVDNFSLAKKTIDLAIIYCPHEYEWEYYLMRAKIKEKLGDKSACDDIKTAIQKDSSLKEYTHNICK